MIIQRVISGGQTGADFAGWRAARAAGIPCGGWMVGNYWTEDGNRPEYAAEYGAAILPDVGHLRFNVQLRRRAEANVRDSDGTFCFDLVNSRATINAELDCKKHGKHFRLIRLYRMGSGRIARDWRSQPIDEVADWVRVVGIRTLNVCGNRESKAPGIEDFVVSFMTETFQLLAEAGHLKMTEDTR
jgi:hypothetical protein